MTSYTLEEAQTRLKDLLEAAMRGETIWITDETGQAIQLMPVMGAHTPGPREPGSAKGLIWMSDDFDEPLDDFRQYME